MATNLSIVRLVGVVTAVLAMLLGSMTSMTARADSSLEINYPSYIGRVTQVSAGDTLRMVLVDGHEVKVRLAGLQAPVANEPFADASRQWLQRHLLDQVVSIDCDPKTDKGPLLRCVVYPDDRDINYLALRFGIARVLQPDLRSAELAVFLDADRYLSAESIARDSQLGIWAVSTLSAVSR